MKSLEFPVKAHPFSGEDAGFPVNHYPFTVNEDPKPGKQPGFPVKEYGISGEANPVSGEQGRIHSDKNHISINTPPLTFPGLIFHGEAMARFNSKTQGWLDQLPILAAEFQKIPLPTTEDLTKTLKAKPAMVSYLKTLNTLFDPATMDKVRQATQADPPYDLSFNNVRTLLGLKGRVKDFPAAFHEALDVVLARRLKTRHIENLVEWIASGNPAKDFDPKQARNKKRETKPKGSVISPPVPGTNTPGEPEITTSPAAAKKSKLVTLWELPTKGLLLLLKGLWWLLATPAKWLGKQIKKTAAKFAEDPGSFMKNLVIGTLQFIFWGILLCVLIGVLHWGWTHYGRAFVGGKVKELMPSVSAKADNAQASSTPTPSAAPAAQAGTTAKTHSPRGYREIQPPEELKDRVQKSKEFGHGFRQTSI